MKTGTSALTQHERIREKAKRLEKEFLELKSNPGLNEIMQGFFIYDGAFVAPSNDLILLIIGGVLKDKELLDILYELTEEEGFKKIATLIAATSEEAVSNMAQLEATRQVTFSLLYTDDFEGERASHWWPLVDTLRTSELAIERLLAKKAIDLLVARALWHLDTASLEALAVVTRELEEGVYDKGRSERDVAREIIEYNTFLTQRLGRTPSKSECKEFLLGIDENLSDSPKTWSKAFKLAGVIESKDRKQKKDTFAISRLINEVNRNQSP